MHTEQDTFDRLRRSSYAEACTEYTMVFLQYDAIAGEAWCKKYAEEILQSMGWTLTDLEHYERTYEI
jgi:hypothetical protein